MFAPAASVALAAGCFFQHGFQRLDDVDRAQSISDAFLGEALLRQKRSRSEGVSAMVCVDCGDDIPEARRMAVVTDRCIHCAEAQERTGRVCA